MPNLLTPSKIICVGLNYRDHAAELDMALPEAPVLFMKPPTAVIGHEDDIIYPAMSNRVDYEAELAVVIGKTARHITPEEAPSFVAGFTCANDVTARDLQQKDGQWTRAKSFDTFAPLGPKVVSGVNPSNLDIKLLVNGVEKQKSNTGQMIFDPFYLVSFVSRIMTLHPGDVIMTGTPPGIGQLNPGDEVTVTIEGIGSLTNRVVSEIA